MSAFDLKFIFSRMRERYVLTVFTLRKSSLAISETLWPAASLQKIWNSRSESWVCDGWSAAGPAADQPSHTQLSEREFQIFCKLAGGQSVSEIAKELFLSVKTVSTYRSRILEKMNFKSNADITYYAVKNQLIA